MTLQWQETDKNQFAVFIRDLSKNLNNVKHMVEDTMKQAPVVKHPKKGKKHKPVKKKKDIIIRYIGECLCPYVSKFIKVS